MQPEASNTGGAPFDDEISDEAAAWLSRQDRGLSASQEKEFEIWMGVPRQAAEFARIERTWRDLDQIKADPELVRMARRWDKNARADRPRRFAAYGALGMAAAAAILMVIWRRPSIPAVPSAQAPATALAYRVVPSAARLLTLPDGSVVELRGNSEVSTDFTPAVRGLRLIRGEAHFKVTKNPARPFIVSVGNVAVRAVGTAFDIQFCKNQVEVVVTEGKVTVEDLGSANAAPAVPLLVAGQRATMFEDGSSVSRTRTVVDLITPSQLEQALAWQSTWLVFDRTPLEKAVEAFNGNSSHRIILGDASLANRRLGGMFRADNVDGFVRLLEQSVDVRSERRGENEIVLLPAHQ
jgi:transmembrane sensor